MAAVIERLWDYGWLSCDRVTLPGATTDIELVEQYLASGSFHTSFLPNDKCETGLHGPFVAERIMGADFVPLEEDELGRYLASIELSDTPGEDALELAKVLPHLRAAFVGGRRCRVLRRDERDRELFHEWGSVFFVFRELLFISPDRDTLERFVIGYD